MDDAASNWDIVTLSGPDPQWRWQSWHTRGGKRGQLCGRRSQQGRDATRIFPYLLRPCLRTIISTFSDPMQLVLSHSAKVLGSGHPSAPRRHVPTCLCCVAVRHTPFGFASDFVQYATSDSKLHSPAACPCAAVSCWI